MSNKGIKGATVTWVAKSFATMPSMTSYIQKRLIQYGLEVVKEVNVVNTVVFYKVNWNHKDTVTRELGIMVDAFIAGAQSIKR